MAPCHACKIIVYDGLSYAFPQIIENKSGLNKTSNVRASTFSLFVVLAHTDGLWNASFTYKADFIETKTIHLSDKSVITNQRSQWSNQTHHARFCLFKLKSPETKILLLSIRKIDFQGRLHGSNLFASVVVFDVINGSLVKLFELLHDVHPNVEIFLCN